MTKKEIKAMDKEIDRLFKENCANVQINMFDISKVFKAGEAAYIAGGDVKQAIIDMVQEVRRN